MTKQVKVTLDEVLEKKFEELKHELGLTVDAEVFRQMLILQHRRVFDKSTQLMEVTAEA